MSLHCLLYFMFLFGSIYAYTNGSLSCSFRDGTSCGWDNDEESWDKWELNYYNVYVRIPYFKGTTIRNCSARLVSPRYDSHLSRNGCFSFVYKMTTTDKPYTRTTAFRVYQKPHHMTPKALIQLSDEEKLNYMIFEIWGDLGEQHYTSVSTLMQTYDDFQIVIEGIYSLDRMYMTINDVAILQGSECTAAKISASTPDSMFYEFTSTTLIPTTSSTTTPVTTITPTTTTEIFLETTTEMLLETTTDMLLKTTTDMLLETTTMLPPRGVNDSLSCDFHNSDLCGWTNDVGATDGWLVNIAVYPRTHGYFRYKYFNDSPFLGNRTLRLVSPLYSRVLDGEGCFSFSYCMYTATHNRNSSIQVYQKPYFISLEEFVNSEDMKKDYILFGVWGNLGYDWFNSVSILRQLDYDFQIIIEGVTSEQRVYMAIDDVAILQGRECTAATIAATTPDWRFFETTSTTSRTTSTSRPTTMSTTTTTTTTTTSWPTTPQRQGAIDIPSFCSFHTNNTCGWENDKTAFGKWNVNDKYAYVTVPFFEEMWRRNITAHYISPVYSHVLEKDGCFVTSYKIMADKLDGGYTGLRIYQMPKSLTVEKLLRSIYEFRSFFIIFETFGNLGDNYYDSVSELNQFVDDFQIIIEGIYSRDHIYHIAVQNVAILQGEACLTSKTKANTPDSSTTTPTTSTTTTLRPTTTPQPTTTPRPTTPLRPTTMPRALGPNDTLTCEFDYHYLCGWRNDPRTLHYWYSMHDPSEDEDYLFFTSSSWPGSDTIRLISPLYHSVLTRNGCFAFSYKLNKAERGRSTAIRVYQIPENIFLQDFVTCSDENKKNFSIFEISEDLGSNWHDNVTMLKDSYNNFQIVIEGTFGGDFVYMAIDNVSILQGRHCDAMTLLPSPTTAPLPTTVPSTTTNIPLTTTTLNSQDLNESTVAVVIIVVISIVAFVLVCILVSVLNWKRDGPESLNTLWTSIAGTYARRNADLEAKTTEVGYSTTNVDTVVITCKDTQMQQDFQH
ncbi:uncharacterized protein LOC112049605 isoform X2 [Bicyclus anynana]|uniref:Uncharacterized protein LOC112049605 isoform X2 n=1 Tax=Bicyclus anynana TaxID=110368 RepID=A0ABM3M1G9_BICAN|nr:uncharacterized protein LOC112049605 isoform X2 [Bicyclus anynana]